MKELWGSVSFNRTYTRNKGFWFWRDFVEMEDCEALRERAMQMITEYEPRDHISIFTNNEQSRHSDGSLG